jgi:hypothetical protein
MESQYAEQLRLRFAGSDNLLGRPVRIRDVSEHIGYSYEHVRQVLLGEPVGSRTFNNALCDVAGLDADEMWKLARHEKAARRYGLDFVRQLAPPPDRRMIVLWKRLTSAEKTQLVQIAEGLVARRTARKSASVLGAEAI